MADARIAGETDRRPWPCQPAFCGQQASHGRADDLAERGPELVEIGRGDVVLEVRRVWVDQRKCSCAVSIDCRAGQIETRQRRDGVA